MVLGSEVKAHGSLQTGFQTAIERARMLTTAAPCTRDRLFSQAFIRRRTQFESVDAFCETCPCEDDTLGSVQGLSADERDPFVDRTTEFETWAEMKRSAAVADLVTLHNG